MPRTIKQHPEPVNCYPIRELEHMLGEAAANSNGGDGIQAKGKPYFGCKLTRILIRYATSSGEFTTVRQRSIFARPTSTPGNLVYNITLDG